MSVTVRAPSTLGKQGYLEMIEFRHEPGGTSEIDFAGSSEAIDQAIREQAGLAHTVICAGISESWLANLVRTDISQGRIIISFGDKAARGESSFGLAFALGMLSLSLDIKPRADRSFTGAIREQSKIQDGPDKEHRTAGLILKQVGGLTAKTEACAKMKCSELLYPYERDTDELQYLEREYWAGNSALSCRLVGLNPLLRVANLINLGLELDTLWHRIQNEHGIHVAWQLLEAMASVQHDTEFPTGVGDHLAGLRKNHLIPAQDERAMRNRFRRWRSACPLEHTGELLKAVISQDPARVLDVDTVETPASVETDITRWIEGIEEHEIEDIPGVLDVLNWCRSIATDFAVYRSSAIRVLHQIRQQLLGTLKEAFGNGRIDSLAQILRICRLFAEVAMPIDVSQLAELKSTLEQPLRSRIQMSDKTARTLVNLLHHIDAAQLVSRGDLPRHAAGNLDITFASVEPTANASEPFWITPLRASFCVAGPTKAESTMPSPIMLFDSSSTQCGPFSRRRSFALADDAFHRLPLEQAEIIRGAYGRGTCRVGYQLRGNLDVSVLWDPSICSWPPSIDSQLFVAAMEANAGTITPDSVLDVGCATGFLSVAALGLWPSLQRVTLIEPDPGSLALGVTNVLHAASPELHVEKICRRAQDANLSDRADLLLSNPPYLPNRPLVPAGIEMATNGTALLQYLVEHGANLAHEVWLSFSVLVWSEFRNALLAYGSHYSRLQVLHRSFVPFRIPWLEPRLIRKEETEEYSLPELRYYQNVLLERGLLDLDSNEARHQPDNYLAANRPERHLQKQGFTVDSGSADHEALKALMIHLRQHDSHGFRFWHEIRAVRLAAKE